MLFCLCGFSGNIGCPPEKNLVENKDLLPYAGQFVGLNIEIPEGATDFYGLSNGKSAVVVGVQQSPDESIGDKLHVSIFGPPVTAKESWEKRNYLDFKYLDFQDENGKKCKRSLNILNCNELETIFKMMNSGEGKFHGQDSWGVGNKEFIKYFKSQCNEH